MAPVAHYRVVAAAALLAALFPDLAPAAPPSAASSAAYGIYAQFTQDGVRVTFGPLAEIEGRAPPAYDERLPAAQVDQIVPIGAGGVPTPSLFVDAADFTSHVASKGHRIGSISAEADAAIKGIDLGLMLNPPPPSAAARPQEPQPFLALSARHIGATADFSPVFAGHGSAAFDHLVVSGSLVGNQKLEFSRARPAKTRSSIRARV